MKDSAEAGIMWQKMASSREMPYETFLMEYSRILGIKFEPGDECVLSAALDVKRQGPEKKLFISFPGFHKFVRFFGARPDIPKIVELFLQPWFFGHVDAKESESLLQQVPDDYRYLIRFSGRTPGVFVLSIKTTKDLQHFSLSYITDYSQLCCLMKKNQIVKKVTANYPSVNNKKFHWKPLSEKFRPASLVLASNQYKQYKKHPKDPQSIRQDQAECRYHSNVGAIGISKNTTKPQQSPSHDQNQGNEWMTSDFVQTDKIFLK
eukprot:TRINITY_DN8150_c0_g1_i3.p1 TRINITY_DN8150_c0_g1~~TRINITY_DN8150_c0_g1_i3.p1  ORF type:complete len:286 (-),score=71.04 TRINITY_DN8150_c0_g1_i3:123-911(-)